MSTVHIGKGSLDELVFANRNKLYGAYALRKSYPSHMVRSLAIAMSGFLLLFSPLLFSAKKVNINTQPLVVEVAHSLLENSIEIEIPVIEKASIGSASSSNISSSFRITRDPEPTSLPIEPVVSSGTGTAGIGNNSTSLGTGLGSEIGSGMTVVIPEPDPNIVPEFVEKMPEFKGGDILFTFEGHGIVAEKVINIPEAANSVFIHFETNGLDKVSLHHMDVNGARVDTSENHSEDSHSEGSHSHD
jgi:protein TonB